MDQYYLANPQNCKIDRGFKDKVIMINGDNQELFMLSGDFTDKQVWDVLNCMNYAFRRGFKCGQIDKIYEIKRTLDIG